MWSSISAALTPSSSTAESASATAEAVVESASASVASASATLSSSLATGLDFLSSRVLGADPPLQRPRLRLAHRVVTRGHPIRLHYTLPPQMQEKMQQRKLWISVYRETENRALLPEIRCDDMEGFVNINSMELELDTAYTCSLKEGEVWPMITTLCDSDTFRIREDPLEVHLQKRNLDVPLISDVDELATRNRRGSAPPLMRGSRDEYRSSLIDDDEDGDEDGQAGRRKIKTRPRMQSVAVDDRSSRRSRDILSQSDASSLLKRGARTSKSTSSIARESKVAGKSKAVTAAVGSPSLDRRNDSTSAEVVVAVVEQGEVKDKDKEKKVRKPIPSIEGIREAKAVSPRSLEPRSPRKNADGEAASLRRSGSSTSPRGEDGGSKSPRAKSPRGGTSLRASHSPRRSKTSDKDLKTRSLRKSAASPRASVLDVFDTAGEGSGGLLMSRRSPREAGGTGEGVKESSPREKKEAQSPRSKPAAEVDEEAKERKSRSGSLVRNGSASTSPNGSPRRSRSSSLRTSPRTSSATSPGRSTSPRASLTSSDSAAVSSTEGRRSRSQSLRSSPSTSPRTSPRTSRAVEEILERTRASAAAQSTGSLPRASSSSSIPSSKGGEDLAKVVIMKKYASQREEEVSAKIGEVFQVLETIDDKWIRIRRGENEGLFPLTHAMVYGKPSPRKSERK